MVLWKDRLSTDRMQHLSTWGKPDNQINTLHCVVHRLSRKLQQCKLFRHDQRLASESLLFNLAWSIFHPTLWATPKSNLGVLEGGWGWVLEWDGKHIMFHQLLNTGWVVAVEIMSPHLTSGHQLWYNITLLPLIAWGMFCGAKYTHHTFTSIIKHKITTTANKHPGKKSFTDKNIKNPTGIKLCISHKTATSRGLKIYCPNKSNYVNCVKDSQLCMKESHLWHSTANDCAEEMYWKWMEGHQPKSSLINTWYHSSMTCWLQNTA